MNPFAKFVLLTLMLCSGASCSGQTETSVDGFIDARRWEFGSQRLPLDGVWKFHDSRLLSPSDAFNEVGSYVSVPIIWNDVRSSGSGIGYATYCIKVIVPPVDVAWAVEIPQLYNSYSLWANGELIATNGKVGTSKDTSVPQWKPQIASFQSSKDTLELVLQISNFHHHKGGIRESIHFGTAPLVSRYDGVAFASVLTEVILLAVESLFFVIFFFVHKRRPVILYFAFFCLFWAIRGMFSNLYPITYFYPDFDWEVMVKIEYIMLYLVMIFATLFLNSLCKEVSSELFKYLIVPVNVLFIVFSLFTSPIIFTRWLELYLVVAGVILVYALITVTRALIVENSGLWFLMGSLILGIFLMGYDVVAYKGYLVNSYLVTSVGYIIFFTSLTLGLFTNLGILKSRTTDDSVLNFSDLYKTEEKNP